MTSPQITEVRRLYAEAEDAISGYERVSLCCLIFGLEFSKLL